MVYVFQMRMRCDALVLSLSLRHQPVPVYDQQQLLNGRNATDIKRLQPQLIRRRLRLQRNDETTEVYNRKSDTMTEKYHIVSTRDWDIESIALF